MKFRTLGICALALAAFTSTAAHADTFTFNFEGLLFSGSGTFTGTEIGTTDLYNITQVTGSVTSGAGTSDIKKLLGDNKFQGNDNVLIYPGTPGIFGEKFFDSDGVSFSLDNGNDVNLNDTWGFENAVGGPPRGFDFPELDIVDVDKNGSDPAVPEPSSLALFGTGILGLAGAVRRRLGA
jgi:hypothetical protein